jgi:L-asparaginase
MKNILLVFTGGTIGSAVSDGVIDTNKTQGFKLLELFHHEDPQAEDIKFTSLQPLQILSENMAPSAWQILFNAIESQNLASYDGIIVTHGTDTLAYTAAALSYYFNALKVPILSVSSDYSLDDARANGLSNFRCAVDFIRQRIRAGVFVPYANQNQTMQVHHGARLTCSLQLTVIFIVCKISPLCTIKIKYLRS